MDDKAFYVPVGNGTETGFLKFLQDAEIPIHDLIKDKIGRIEANIPFSSIRKRSVTVMRHPLYQDLIRVYVKGAPEYIVDKCTKTYDVDGRTIPMAPEQLTYIKNDIIKQKFTTQGYRAIAFAYRDCTVSDFELLKKSFNNF